MPSSVLERIAKGRDALVRGGIAPFDASLDAELLARHVLGWDRATLLTRGREDPPADFADRFDDLIERRTLREPVAQITGHREFWGLDFEVTPDVLVPRPETESIVEAALELADRARPLRILDVGTGSGCLAIALAVELPASHVIASDVSAAALRVARRNAARLRVSERVLFVCASLLDAVSGPFDLIVSNPPYVATTEPLPPDVAIYEPRAALFAGPEGLDALRGLIGTAASHLVPGGSLIVEFGFGQSEAVRAMASAAGWRRSTILEDLQGIERTARLDR
jgi:release factor glutamine methyltransferase